MPRTMLDPLFTAVDAPAFTESHLARLATGTLAAVRVPGFLTPEQCQAATTAFDRMPTAGYDPLRVPTSILHVGPSLNDYRTLANTLDTSRYWKDADAARSAWHRARMQPDPITVALARLGDAWGTAVTPATIGGRCVFGGTLREMNEGALVHYDEASREYPAGLFDQTVIAQLAFNLWAQAPVMGGATTVWRHRWEPADEQHREAYGYRREAVEGCQHVTLTPRPGDALLFNPANFHAVDPNPGERRIAFALFLAITSTGQLINWS
ncbi:proline hydroxylase [Streptomyces sp. NPDC050485]|uniref:2OG-Fe(II)-dependent halogenase WelO5 family protein n=1 Tax=Streptomyces sp. NPDC050485 TaxID=3365617 RepID=UPI0037A05363